MELPILQFSLFLPKFCSLGFFFACQLKLLFSAEEQERLRRKIGELFSNSQSLTGSIKWRSALLRTALTAIWPLFWIPAGTRPLADKPMQLQACWQIHGKRQQSYVASAVPSKRARNCFDWQPLVGWACPRPRRLVAESNLELDKIQQKQSTSLKPLCNGLLQPSHNTDLNIFGATN